MTELKVLTADQQVANILAADARRVRRLTWVTVGVWAFTVPTATATLLLYWFVAGPVVARHREVFGSSWLPLGYWHGRAEDPNTQSLLDRLNAEHLTTQLALVVSVNTVLLCLSALGTVLLVHASRRATLRQIQASLAAIAGQLAEVQRGRGTMPPTAGG